MLPGHFAYHLLSITVIDTVDVGSEAVCKTSIKQSAVPNKQSAPPTNRLAPCSPQRAPLSSNRLLLADANWMTEQPKRRSRYQTWFAAANDG